MLKRDVGLRFGCRGSSGNLIRCFSSVEQMEWIGLRTGKMLQGDGFQ